MPYILKGRYQRKCFHQYLDAEILYQAIFETMSFLKDYFATNFSTIWNLISDLNDYSFSTEMEAIYPEDFCLISTQE